ncbi:MAG: site-2 protease family protein [Myxococcota bacterium]
MNPEVIRNIALMMPALLFSLCVHEYAHAWAATRLGDSTPSSEGRLTLSPASHVDLLGSIIFPILLILSGGMVFGWAKPVRFSPVNFRGVSMRRGAALTAVAGPLSNILLALGAALALRLVFTLELDDSDFLGQLLQQLFYLNALLAVFNLVPLPPLDGSYLLPASMDGLKATLQQYSFLIFAVIFFIPLVGGRTLGSFVLGPVTTVLIWCIAKLAGFGS